MNTKGNPWWIVLTLVAAFILAFAGCGGGGGGGGGSDDTGPTPDQLATAASAVPDDGTNCGTAGGWIIYTGIDEDGDGVLDVPDEVDEQLPSATGWTPPRRPWT